MHIDIVIPAFNNEGTIGATLHSVAEQRLPSGVRVRALVIDDGSTDGTVQVVRQKAGAVSIPIEVISSSHAGAGQARNRALDAVDGEYVFFLNADNVLRPNALRAHALWHQRHGGPLRATLGLIMWDAALRPTPLMEWFVHGGPQNSYDDLLGATMAPPEHYFTAANILIPAAALEAERFSPELPGYGWEDLELGRRLAAQGLSLHVVHDAVAMHAHQYSGPDCTERQVAVGWSLVRYQQLHQGVALVPSRPAWHRPLVRILWFCGAVALLRALRNWYAGRRSWPALFALVAALDLWIGVYSHKGPKKGSKEQIS